MHAWLAALCGMAGGGALAALPLFIARSGHFEPLPDDTERQKTRIGRDAASAVTLDEVMASLPAATLVLNDTRLPCVISPEAKRQFTNSLAALSAIRLFKVRWTGFWRKKRKTSNRLKR